MTVDYNNVTNFLTLYSGAASAGANDIFADPLFADASDGNYRLAKGSPCIDKGTPFGAGQTITAGSTVIDDLLSADGQGFNAGQGPAPGGFNLHSGGNHGGEGSHTISLTYGSVHNPTTLGSGGVGAINPPGGGAIVLSITGPLTIDGTVSANAAVTSGGHSGSGGSITITAGSLSGNGRVPRGSGPGMQLAIGVGLP